MNEQEKVLRKNIGKKIKLARAKAEYTQEQLAEKLSLSTRYISQLERGIAFGSAILFEIHFKITGDKYTGILNEYKNRKNDFNIH